MAVALGCEICGGDLLDNQKRCSSRCRREWMRLYGIYKKFRSHRQAQMAAIEAVGMKWPIIFPTPAVRPEELP